MGWAFLVKTYVVPYLIVNFWLVTITLLQHTHPGAWAARRLRTPFGPLLAHLLLLSEVAPRCREGAPLAVWPKLFAPPPEPRPPPHTPLCCRPPRAELPHYTDDEWDWLRGALATVDRNYGWLLNTLHHHIAVRHPSHPCSSARKQCALVCVIPCSWRRLAPPPAPQLQRPAGNAAAVLRGAAQVAA